MTVGFYAPLPPAKSGVAEYASALLSALREDDVRIGRDGDVNLYHLGNNQLHARIYQHAIERPGVVVLHDAVLQHFFLGSLGREDYINEFAYNYGDWTRDTAASLWEGRARSVADNVYFSYPMLKRIGERSLALIVHNPAAAKMLQAHCASARVIEIPHLLAPAALPHPAEVERFRAQFGIGPVFGLLGHIRESKRVMTVLRVFARLSGCTLLLAGEIASSDLRRAIAPYMDLPNVRRMGFMDRLTYWQVALALDACINLRYPAAGETSGVSIGLMGVGKPVIMTDSDENSRYPEDVCIRVTAGLSEAEELESILDWCLRSRSGLQEMGRRAKAFVRKEHAIDRVAQQYREVLGSVRN